jgi:hypothetical protein
MLDSNGNIIDGRLQEVWFPGAHSDVGGGYQDSMMSGVSLNWMIERIAKAESDAGAGPEKPLLPPGAGVNEDPFGRSHDPEAGIFGPIYHNINRNIGAYLTDAKHLDNRAATMCVHKSVIERRRTVALKEHENHYLALTQPGEICLKDSGKFAKPAILEQVMTPGYQCTKADRKLVVQVWPDCDGQIKK